MKFNPRDSVYRNISEGTLIRVIYSAWDIQQALSALMFLLEDCDFKARYNPVELRRFRCYEANMVISFARPFEKTSGRSTLGLKTVGIELTDREKQLKAMLLNVRRKIIAHSDEEMMHFKSYTFKIFEDTEVVMPHIIHDEGLNFEENVLLEFELFFAALKENLLKFIFKLSQKNPAIMEMYKQPNNSS